MPRSASPLSLLLATSLLLAVPGSVDAQSPRPGTSDAESAVRRLERQWLDAYEKNDAAAMDRIVANDFVITFPEGGQQTKAQIVAMLRKRTGPSTIRFRTEDVRSIVRHSTVILVGVVVTTELRDGKPVESRMRYTDTYARDESGWQVVASGLSQWTPPAPATAKTPATPNSPPPASPDSTP